MLHVNFQPGLKFLPGCDYMLKRVKNSALRLFQSCLNPVLIRHVFTIDYVKLRRNHAEFRRSKNN